MRTYEREAAPAGHRLDVQLTQRARDDRLHLAPEEAHPLGLHRALRLQHVRQRGHELQEHADSVMHGWHSQPPGVLEQRPWSHRAMHRSQDTCQKVPACC